MTATVRIHNWDKWQSYRRDRGQPPWIKVHRLLMRDPNWIALSDAQRGQLVAIWLLAADHDGVIPASPALVQKICYMDSEPDFQVLVSLGFIEPDANLTPSRRQRDSTETEAEEIREETEKNTLRVVAVELDELWAIHGRGTKHKAATELRKALDLESFNVIRAQLIAYTKTFRPDFHGQHLWRWLRDCRWEEKYAPTNTGVVARKRSLDRTFKELGIT